MTHQPARLSIVFLLLANVSVTATQVPSREATPAEPIAAILDAFRRHDIVALTDPHGNVEAQAFLLSLLRHPQFPEAVNDIVIETASARYQDAIDRFVRGDDIRRDVLRKAWEDHTVGSSLGIRQRN